MTEKTKHDDADARRWRGPLFDDFRSPIGWKDKYFETLQPPRSVTFPICNFCNHVVWDWPHFEEQVPDNAVCGRCWKREERESRR